jgi:hypothetical protein
MTGLNRLRPGLRVLYEPVTTGYDWFFAVFFGPGPVIWPFLFIDNRSGYWFTQKWQKNQTRPDLKALVALVA